MAYRIRRVEYFHATVVDQPGEAYRVLSALAGLGVNLLAFTGVPVGPDRTQITLFPEDPGKMKLEANRHRHLPGVPHKPSRPGNRPVLEPDDRCGRHLSVHGGLAPANGGNANAAGNAKRAKG